MNFTDMQILTLIRAHPGLNLYQLTKKANEELYKRNNEPWTIGGIQKSVQRLRKAKKIETRLKVNGGKSCLELYCKI